MIRFVFALVLAACTPAGFLPAGDVVTVVIDGEEIGVQKLEQSENTYAAAPIDLTGGFIDPAQYVRNVAAIEAVSGCKVRPVSVVNQGLQTLASVSC